MPAHIAEAASEAHECHSIGANRAAILMARSVLEATAKDCGATKGNLQDKIDTLHVNEKIGRFVREQAHEIRYFGNDMAHGDFVVPVTEEEASEILGLMAVVLNEVYEAPAKLEELRQARLARKEAVQGEN
ncbi:DUF4145 domain-containing protein [Saccharopolyspora sp. K220]|uniref:DUF4145 domain-containing protein n=1 Tax=Saccharopolyspora soli TaxID=2926618 RepID=UPI001F563611|nr:DUF4145 domain-containing protein [Saccharopolyspora soli]MCI2421495.1 DUF4145 domain-containing protein [Saccharopolyspora soli]